MFPPSDSGGGYQQQGGGSSGNAFLKHAVGEPLRLLKKTVDSLNAGIIKYGKNLENISKQQAKLLNQTSGQKIGLDGRPTSANKVAEGMGKMGNLSSGARIGLGTAAVVAGSGALAYSMMPGTAEAVTQRMGLNALLTGRGGMGPNSVLQGLNRALAGGTTGVGSPTQAGMALTYQAGMLATTPYNMKTIMPQMAGLSAMTGGTNQQMAGAMGSINSMNFMRSATQTRDAQGRLLPINQIINNLFRSMYGGQKITPEQAALIYNPGSPSHKTVMQAAGGDPNLFAVLAEGIRTRAMAGKNLTAKQMSSADSILDIRGVPKNDPMRANFRNNFAKNKLLGATQQGLVSGYDSAVNANASLTSGFADMAAQLGPVTEGLAKLKGVLQTFPGTGSVGGTLSGVASNALSFGLASKLMGGGFGFGGAGAAAGAVGAAGAASKLLGPNGMPISSGPVVAPTGGRGGFRGSFGRGLQSSAGRFGLGALAVGATTYAADKIWKAKHGNKRVGDFGVGAASVGMSALSYAALGSMFGPVGAGIGAVVGTGIGLMSNMGNFTGQGGMGGGDDCGHGNMPHNCSGGMGGGDSAGATSVGKFQSPVPPGTKVTSPFGPRPGAHKKDPKISLNHTGIDFGVRSGSAVAAAGDGTVTEVGMNPKYGRYIIINHGKKSTLYAHLSKAFVSKGDTVSAGQQIALSGGNKGQDGAGNSSGAHLHFEIRDPGSTGAQGRVNPANFFGKTFNFVKNVITKGINLVKGIWGGSKSTTTESSSAIGINFNKKDIGSLSSGSINDFLSGSLTSSNYLGSNSKGNLTGSDTVTPESVAKAKSILGAINYKEDLVSGDKGGMVGGSRAGLIKMLYDGGFRGKGLSTAFAVALAESGGTGNERNSKGRDLSYGLFQINMKDDDPASPHMGRNRRKQFGIAKNEELYNPSTNIKAALKVSNNGTWWNQWTTFTSGRYSKYLDDAGRAATQAKIPYYHNGSYSVPKGGMGGGDEHLAMVQEKEMILPAKLAEKVRNGTGFSPGNTTIKVDMKVNIARSSVQEAEYMFTYFKDKLERELKNNVIGTY